MPVARHIAAAPVAVRGHTSGKSGAHGAIGWDYSVGDKGGARGWASWKQGVKGGASHVPGKAAAMANKGTYRSLGSVRVPEIC